MCEAFGEDAAPRFFFDVSRGSIVIADGRERMWAEVR
jgi:hypothetical protein